MMNWTIYYATLAVMAFVGSSIWSVSLFRRGKTGRGIIVMLIAPAISATLVWAATLFAVLCINGI